MQSFYLLFTARAAVGTYGVITHASVVVCRISACVERLGAGTLDVFRLVLADGMKAPLIGLGVGLLLVASPLGAISLQMEVFNHHDGSVPLVRLGEEEPLTIR